MQPKNALLSHWEPEQRPMTLTYVGSRARLFKDSKRGRKDQERVHKATDLRSEVAIADPCLLYLQMLGVCILMDHPSAFKTAPGKGSSSAGAAGPCVCVKASQRRSPLRPRLFTQTAAWPRGGGLCAVFLFCFWQEGLFINYEEGPFNDLLRGTAGRGVRELLTSASALAFKMLSLQVGSSPLQRTGWR